MTKNQIEYWRNVETNRNNRAVETETNRSNLARELETNRANLAKENETHRSNVAHENETHRSNVANERLQQQNLNLLARNQAWNRTFTRQSQAEVARANLAREAETKRSNTANESIKQVQSDRDYAINKRAQSTAVYDAQTRRLTQMSQAEKFKNDYAVNLLNLAETNRSNEAREQENVRTNLANESIKRQNVNLGYQQLNETRRMNRVAENLKFYQIQTNLAASLANTAVNAIGQTARLTNLGGVIR